MFNSILFQKMKLMKFILASSIFLSVTLAFSYPNPRYKRAAHYFPNSPKYASRQLNKPVELDFNSKWRVSYNLPKSYYNRPPVISRRTHATFHQPRSYRTPQPRFYRKCTFLNRRPQTQWRPIYPSRVRYKISFIFYIIL